MAGRRAKHSLSYAYHHIHHLKGVLNLQNLGCFKIKSISTQDNSDESVLFDKGWEDQDHSQFVIWFLMRDLETSWVALKERVLWDWIGISPFQFAICNKELSHTYVVFPWRLAYSWLPNNEENRAVTENSEAVFAPVSKLEIISA